MEKFKHTNCRIENHVHEGSKLAPKRQVENHHNQQDVTTLQLEKKCNKIRSQNEKLQKKIKPYGRPAPQSVDSHERW